MSDHYDRYNGMENLLGTDLAEVGTDCISRQQAIDAIGEKSDEIYKTKQNGATYPHDDFFQGMAYAENVVKQLPSAEPKIIYCGECTKMKVDSVFHDCWCSETGKKVWINHYCGYAERREVQDENDKTTNNTTNA